MKVETQKIAVLGKNALVIGSFSLSVYFVIALWNFWSTFVDALGFNSTVFILGFVLLFLASYRITDWKKHALWIVPVVLIALSFSLWENPYLKIVSILLLPLIMSVVFGYALLPTKTIDIWFVLLSIIGRMTLIFKLKAAVSLVCGRWRSTEGENKKIFSRVVLGLLLFSILALTVFIPLLSSVDPQFAVLMRGVLDWFYQVLSFRYMGRIAFASIATVLIIGYFLSFERRSDDMKGQSLPQKTVLDPVISGIVLGGVLMIYVVFIALQLPYLWVNQLPVDFQSTEQLVKSGFWQLLLLSVINIIFFFGYFKKTNTGVQNILKAFTIASFLLLISAGHRMFLYILFYGLSYEKFFASYTVIYCAILFAWLSYKLFLRRGGNLAKHLIFSLLWMYGIATIMPVERIIFSFNAEMSRRADSRIKMNELRMLSYDVLPLVATYRRDEGWQGDWCYWAEREMRTVARKKWYEKNLANFADIRVPERWKKTEGCTTLQEQTIPSEPEPTLPEDTQTRYNDTDFSFQVKYPNKEWRIIQLFDFEKNQKRGIHLYKDEKTDVSIQPIGNARLTIDHSIKPRITRLSDHLTGIKTVWESLNGNGVIVIKLDAYPESWNSEHAIEARYTRDTKRAVEGILESLVLSK
ncbi:MAG: DUF4173 domain-containing protein [Candidatus Moraniibacteriota bacterium]|nr:MAG: DUF4173 domain-containing protein [Candidatus Moranbacteria bacterium]